MNLHVGIFFYNQAQYVDGIFEDIKVLLSADNIDLKTIKITIFDDGSSDDTQSIIKRNNCEFMPQINLRLSPLNQGVMARVDEFMSLIDEREFILFVAGDDRIMVDGLLQAYLFLEKNENFSAVICNAWRYVDDKVHQAHPNFWPYTLINKSGERFYKFLQHFYPRPLLVQATLFRADNLRRIHAFDWKSRLDDWPLFLRLFSNKSEIIFLNNIFISKYIYNDKSVSANPSRILDLVSEVSKEFSLLNLWGPLSQVEFRKFLVSIKNKNIDYKIHLPKLLVGFIMEIYYKCRSMQKL